MATSSARSSLWKTISSLAAISVVALAPDYTAKAANGFSGIIQEASIASLHEAIAAGEITCGQIIGAYLARIDAFNGQCTVPAPDPRAGVEGYKGPLLDGYTGALRSDSERTTIYGNFAAAENGQLNALIVTNLRGERSSTCPGACDVKDEERLPRKCPSVCELSRDIPDAREEAARLDALYGSDPPFDELPLYCIPFSAKDTIDSSQMRSTGGGDAVYDHDRAGEDATVVSRVRAAGAIMLGQANLSEYNGGFGSPNDLEDAILGGNGSTVAGHMCNPYDTTRGPGGSSGGSGSSVGANLVVCSFCEETGGSCRNPGNVNGAAVMMGSQGFFSKFGLNPGSRIRDRIGVICRRVEDLARVAEVAAGYDPESTESPDSVFHAFEPERLEGRKTLEGIKLGIVREHMVPWTLNDADRVEKFNAELPVLRSLGVQLVESVDPEYIARMGDDPAIPNMTTDFNDAIATILPYYAPGYMFQVDDEGEPTFPSLLEYREDRITTGVDLFFGDLTLPAAIADGHLSLRRLQSFPGTPGEFKHTLSIYLRKRGDAKIYDFDTLNADSNFMTDLLLDTEDARSQDPKWLSADRQNFLDHAAETDLDSKGLNQRIMIRYAMRQVIAKVVADNGLHAFINPLSTLPPAKIGKVGDPSGPGLRPGTRFPLSADAGIPEVVVPMGFSTIAFDPVMVLNSSGRGVTGEPGTKKTLLPAPGLPFGVSFWSGPGTEAALLSIASSYERATKHRAPPDEFGPLPGEP